MSDIKQKLQELAQLSLFASRISEIQENNLKKFPFVFFEQVQEAQVEYDLGHGINNHSKEINHNSFVTYHLTLNKDANANFLNKRFAALENGVRSLFWKDVKVLIYFNGQLVYGSKDVE